VRLRRRELRGDVRFDRARLDDLGPNPTLHALFGEGYLAVTFDLATSGQRYQGSSRWKAIHSRRLASVIASGRNRSRAPIRLGVRSDVDGCVAGGMLIQHLPRRRGGPVSASSVQLDHPEWEHIQIMGGGISRTESGSIRRSIS